MDWNNDGLNDLLVGDALGYVLVYLNTTDNFNPVLDNGTLIQGYDIKAETCGDLNVGLRATPVVNDWNGDGKKDLLIGNFEGNIVIYLNGGTDKSPVFDSLPYNLRVNRTDFNVGGRAAPRIFDWDRDGLKDLLIGEYEGWIYFLKNVGTNNAPVFNSFKKLLLVDGRPLRYPDEGGAPRSRLFVTDWNNDGLPDILVGGKDGKVMLYVAVP